MNELELLVDFHKDAERQGPGSERETLRALDMIEMPKDNLKMADIGCGTGAQTMTLARHTQGQIVAVDLFPAFLDRLKQKAKELGVQGQISTMEGSMEDLPFDEEAFDIIWSEGAIYIMGFERGVKEWRRYLKPGGYLAVSELTWTTHSRPQEIEAHWSAEYPEMDTASGKIRILEENGYSPVGYFTLSQSSWLDHYYKPIEARMDAFLERHGHAESAKELIAAEKEEIRMYLAYKDYLNYGFYIARKVG